MHLFVQYLRMMDLDTKILNVKPYTSPYNIFHLILKFELLFKYWKFPLNLSMHFDIHVFFLDNLSASKCIHLYVHKCKRKYCFLCIFSLYHNIVLFMFIVCTTANKRTTNLNIGSL